MKKKYFGTDGIRGKVGGSKINPEFVIKLGYSIGKFLTNKYGKSTVLVGKDTRISGYMLESALEAGLSSAGVDIKLLGPMPTPAISYLTKTLRAQAGIVISASHNLFFDNGIKIFDANGRKLSSEMESSIEQEIDNDLVTVESDKLGKATRIVDAPGRYIEFCKSTVPTKFSLKGLKIVLDCAHGATYDVAPHVFGELGAELITIANKPDGLNINEKCGATFPELLVDKVKEHKASLGISLDGDGDRVVLVDDKGEILDGDDVLFITSRYYHEQNILSGGVVGTLMTNIGLEKYYQTHGIKFERVNVGDKYIIARLEENGWSFGGEPSGHIVNFKFNETGDGIIAALQVLLAMQRAGQTLSEIKKGYTKYPNILRNIRIENGNKLLNDKNVQAKISDIQNNLDENTRILVRPSGTEPKIRVMVEGADIDHINQVALDIENIILQYRS